MTERKTRQRQRQTKKQPGSSRVRGVQSNDSDSSIPGTVGQDQSDDASNFATGNPKSPSFSMKGLGKPLMAVALAVVIGAGAFMGFGVGGDQITEEEVQSRQSSYQQLTAGAGMPLTLVSASELQSAMESLPDSVTQEQRVEIEQKVDEGRLQLAWLTLWDTHAEDGDVLRFESSSSIPVDVTALNAKTTLAIPYPVDGSVIVTGVKDGGGGITIALESGATEIAWPTMQPGDSLRLPVTPAY